MKKLIYFLFLVQLAASGFCSVDLARGMVSSSANPVVISPKVKAINQEYSLSVSSSNATPVTFAASILEIYVDNDGTIAYDGGLNFPVLTNATYTTGISGIPYSVESVLAKSGNVNTMNVWIRRIER